MDVLSDLDPASSECSGKFKIPVCCLARTRHSLNAARKTISEPTRSDVSLLITAPVCYTHHQVPAKPKQQSTFGRSNDEADETDELMLFSKRIPPNPSQPMTLETLFSAMNNQFKLTLQRIEESNASIATKIDSVKAEL